MRVRFSPGARADLERIRRWIARDNPARALSFVRELRQRTAVLTDFPELHAPLGQSEAGSIHKLTHGAYLLYYRIGTDVVEVIAVRHGARQAPRFD